MFGLFGGSGGGNANRPPPSSTSADDYDDDEYFDDDEVNKTKVVADFDPDALERGAAALREIDASANARDALRLAMIQEKTKQDELKLQAQQMMAQNLQNQERLMNDEHRNRMQAGEQNQKQWKERAEYEQRLKTQMERDLLEEKKRAQEEYLAKQRQLEEENLRKQRENAMKIEEEKRRTLEYQAKLEQDTARVRAKAESEGMIEQERVNEDVQTRKIVTQMGEERTTKIDLQQARLDAWKDFYSLMNTTLTDKDKLRTLGYGIVGISAGVYGARTGISVMGKYVENHFGKPQLVRETSRMSWRDVVPSRKWIPSFLMRSNPEKLEELQGVILNKSLENKMKFVARSTRKTRVNGTPFRHLLIYGPPGTGKTLFARALAKESGSDYAVLTGGDFAQLGDQAVTELHRVFDWAEASRKGTILFIDESDAFLRKGREGDSMSESMRNALSAFLYRTGTETNKFKIVLATNVPDALDKAVLDRIDDIVEFPLPGSSERRRMLDLYFHKYIVKPEMGAPIETVDFDLDPNVWDELAEKMEGYSGRQIAKYMIQVQKTIYDGMDNKVSPMLMRQSFEVFQQSKFFGFE